MLPLPEPLRLAKTQSDIERTRAFIKQEYGKYYHKISFEEYDPFDAKAYVLYSEDGVGNVTGTIRFVPDSPLGLPEDALFPPLVAQLRQQGKKLMEIGRFSIRNGNPKLLKSYIRTFYDIPYACNIDYVVQIVKRKDLRFYQKIIGIDILIEEINENFGSNIPFSCVGWSPAHTHQKFFQLTARATLGY